MVETGLCASRARAQADIKDGLVGLNGAIAQKAGQPVADSDEVTISKQAHSYVSRGGLKLAAAIEAFSLQCENLVCLDLGASTGGFCDVLLRNGAGKIYAVDVGSGQLHATIRSNPKIINLEKTHAKDLTSAIVPDPIELLTCDVSFISLKKVFPFAMALTAQEARLVALIKPSI